MKNTIVSSLLFLALGTPAWAQSSATKKPVTAPKSQPQKRMEPREADPVALPSAITAALRLGYNIPSSELSSGFVPDLEVGYRIGLGSVAVEPAFGFQTFGGDAAGRATSSQLGAGSSLYEQSASANIYEGRVRGWFDLGAAGSPLFGINVGVVSAETEQESFGVIREEAGSSLTWGLHAGWAYPIPAAYGNIELLLAYRQAAVDFVSAGNENLSGVQVLAGWHAAF